MKYIGKYLSEEKLLTRECSWLSWIVCVTNDHGYVPFVVITIGFFPHSWLITGFVKSGTMGVTCGAGAAYPSEPLLFLWGSCCSIFSFLCRFVDHCLSFCSFSFSHCFVLPFFDLSFWYLQTFLNNTLFL